MSDTPVGERPASGGRVRQYASDAERARAWRDRHRQDREASPAEPINPLQAEATLAGLLGALRDVADGHRTAMSDIARRVEDAVAVSAGVIP